MNSSARDILFAAIRERAILTGDKQRLVAPNGSSNTWLIDMRRIFLDAHLLDTIAELFWQTCADKMPFQVGGMEVAAIPLLSAILMKSVARGTPINGFIIRKERKTYGAGNLIEGVVTDAPIIIVDDILNSAKSLEKVRVVLEQARKRMSSVFVLIDYHHAKGEAWRAAHNIPVISSFDLNDFGIAPRKEGTASHRPIFRNVWSFISPDPNFFHRVPKSFPATDGHRVYFGSDSGFFWCLNAFDGSTVWKFKVNSRGHKNIWSAPALHDGKVFFGSYDGNVYCLDALNGMEIWRFTEADWVGSSPALAPELGLALHRLGICRRGQAWKHRCVKYLDRRKSMGTSDEEIHARFASLLARTATRRLRQQR